MLRKILNKLVWRYYRRKHSIPHPDEIRSLMPVHGLTPRLRNVARLYGLYQFSLEEIAVMPEFNCTRERIRQLVWKIWRTQRVARGLRKAP